MRRSTVTIILITFLAVPFGFLSAQPLVDEKSTEESVETVLKHFSTGYTQWDEKDLYKLGDASAVALAKIFRDRELDEADINRAIMVLRFSFSVPSLIERDTDKQPKAALCFLRYLDLSNKDTGLKTRIAETKEFIVRSYEKPKN
jgi:hypothetical protein